MKNQSNGCMGRAYQIALCEIREANRELKQLYEMLESEIRNLPPVYDAGITPEIEEEHQRVINKRLWYQKNGWIRK